MTKQDANQEMLFNVLQAGHVSGQMRSPELKAVFTGDQVRAIIKAFVIATGRPVSEQEQEQVARRFEAQYSVKVTLDA